MDVHKDSITIAVLPKAAKTPTRLDRLPNELPKLKRFLDRLVGGDAGPADPGGGRRLTYYDAVRPRAPGLEGRALPRALCGSHEQHARPQCLEWAGSRRIQFLPLRHGDVLTGAYQQDSTSMRPQATRPPSHLDSSPAISTPKFTCGGPERRRRRTGRYNGARRHTTGCR
jgi:hypothetical protein